MAKLPEGHHTITPGFVVPGVAKLIEFLQTAFGGKVLARYDGPGGAVMHAEVKIADSVVMMGEPKPPEYPAMPAMLSLYVDDVDGIYKKALAAGATSKEEPNNKFYGHRSARVSDPSGNVWTISKVVEDLSDEEIQKRMASMGHG